MSKHIPQTVAENMVALRGINESIQRCARYVSGAIRSENDKEFWQDVLKHIHAIKTVGNVQNAGE